MSSEDARASMGRVLRVAIFWGSLSLLPATAWLSLVSIHTSDLIIVDLTLPKIIVIAMLPLVALAAILEPSTLLRPAPIMVAGLAFWIVVANVGRDAYAADSFRNSLFFAGASCTAFGAAFLSIRWWRRAYLRALLFLMFTMLAVGAGFGVIERLAVLRAPDGSRVDLVPAVWTFFRPPDPLRSPVLGEVEVIQPHSLAPNGEIRVAGLFASTNLLADFVAMATPLIALPTLLVHRRASAVRRVLAAVVLCVGAQALFWSQSRVGLVALFADVLLVLGAALFVRRRPPRREIWVAVGFGVVLIATALLVDDSLRGRVAGILFPFDRSPTTEAANDSFASARSDAAATTLGHLVVQQIALEMVFADTNSVLFGPGTLRYLQVILDPTSPKYVGVMASPGVGGPHSGYLMFAVAGGMPALLLFIAVIMTSVGPGLRIMFARHRRGVQQYVLVVSLTLCLLGWLIVALVDTNPMLFPETLFLFTLFGALASAVDVQST